MFKNVGAMTTQRAKRNKKLAYVIIPSQQKPRGDKGIIYQGFNFLNSLSMKSTDSRWALRISETVRSDALP